MREKIFRGLSEDGNWYYGMPCKSSYGIELVSFLYHVDGAEWNVEGNEVKAETVGEFTGFKDKNGIDIYEGDIVRHEEYQPPMEFCGYTVFTVEFNDSAFKLVPLKRFNNGWHITEMGTSLIEVIGNIYENPELL